MPTLFQRFKAALKDLPFPRAAGNNADVIIYPNMNRSRRPPTIANSYAAVGFTDSATGNYTLANASAYKGTGTSGSDPGVNMATLSTALGASSSDFNSATFKAITGDWTSGTIVYKWNTNPACI